jgi:hypothetical protein
MRLFAPDVETNRLVRLWLESAFRRLSFSFVAPLAAAI